MENLRHDGEIHIATYSAASPRVGRRTQTATVWPLWIADPV